ncbi:ABC transporter [Paracidovorax cattleyae]|uniref:ABC transporter n=1 Tax=Paracidovorax cattleyae TaxID=80868 RepID=A0A1H0WB69_9BURK|nr:ABC transporter [Paracidovorax cattleyae]
MGLSHRTYPWPATLSGGEAQRAALARGLVREPQLFLLDEPFASLDALTRIRMHALLLNLRREYRPAVLLVTHDVDEAILLADRVLVLARGRIAADLPVSGPRPRRQGDAAFIALRQQLLGLLGAAED